ncbi:hypothetical protein chiPu_0007436 [Chiloscyllium punctatum]|uniref:Uncharacterized protein n=1 Tax=Chiloscyllium punctatum TaxID=137246 RepID=A0A401SF40_CHIPU|nr:hypothetical protein [Chiloscyllium punctatum]
MKRCTGAIRFAVVVSIRPHIPHSLSRWGSRIKENPEKIFEVYAKVKHPDSSGSENGCASHPWAGVDNGYPSVSGWKCLWRCLLPNEANSTADSTDANARTGPTHDAP